MDHDQSVRIVVPGRLASAGVLAACVQAMLARTDGVVDPEGLAARLTAAAAAAHDQLAADGRLQADVSLTATLSVEQAPRRFAFDLASVWRHEEPLPELPVQEAEIDQPGAGAPALDGGAGLLIIRRLMDEVEYWPQPGANRWRLVKLLPPPATENVATADQPLSITLDLPTEYRYLNVASECIRALLAFYPLPGDSAAVYAAQLAVQELCTNIVRHAYAGDRGRLQLTLTLDGRAHAMRVESLDSGLQTFDLAAVHDATVPSPAVRSGLLSGSALLFASATAVNLGNYLFNLLLGRWLGPAAFADLSLVVTLFLMTSFLTAGLQTPTARFAALFAADGDLAGLADLRRWVLRLGAGLGLGLAALFALGAPVWQRFFGAGSAIPFVILGVFVPFYLLQGVDRGMLQGRTCFRRLALSYQAEMWSRLVLSLAAVAVGWAVNGAVLGIGLSFVATWLVVRRVGADLPAAKALPQGVRREVTAFVGPVLIAQLGQVLINNSDILIVRRFFPAEAAGQYAALALTGRIVFFATWSVVMVMFPVAAQRFRRNQAHRPLLYLSLGIVAVISLGIVGVVYLYPEPIVRLLFGPAYLSIAPLLWLYALATMFYALANVVIHYRLSIGSTGGTYLAIGAGVVQVGALWLLHGSLSQVVWVQLVLMAALFLVLLSWDLAAAHPDPDRQERR